MLVLLPSPFPPQIMPLIINRMRACSSWKAGTGTSLLNGAAQLGLKLFNRNMKAPSVRRTQPSEVTVCRPSPASTPVPTARVLLPLLSPCPIRQGSPLHPWLFPRHEAPAAQPGLLLFCCFIQLPHAPFSQPDPFLSSAGVRFFIDPKPKPDSGSLFLSVQFQNFSLQHSLPLGWDGLLLSTLQSPSYPHTVCPHSPPSLLGGGRAEPCPPWQHPTVEFVGEKVLLWGLRGGREPGLHAGRWQHVGTGGKRGGGDNDLGLSAARSRG